MTDSDIPIIIGVDDNNKVNWNSIISMFAIVLGMLLISLAKCIQVWIKKKIAENKLEIVRTTTSQLPMTPVIGVEPSPVSSEKVDVN